MTMHPDVAREIQRQVLKHLSADPTHVRARSMRAEFMSGDDVVTVEWECSATIPIEQFKQIFNAAAQCVL